VLAVVDDEQELSRSELLCERLGQRPVRIFRNRKPAGDS
jgi:hypothetical protein